MSERRRDRDFIGDILEAMGNIALYTGGLTYGDFVADGKTRDAVVRNFEVIGEAAKNITPALKALHPEIPWKKLAGLRDKLVHFYFGVDYRIVWNIAKKELPKLKRQVEGLP